MTMAGAVCAPHTATTGTRVGKGFPKQEACRDGMARPCSTLEEE